MALNRADLAAICVACGAAKSGSCSPCAACGHEPRTATEQAQALLLSERYLEPGKLVAAAAAIRGGQPAKFDEVMVRDLATQLVSSAQAPPPSKIGLAFFVLGFLLAIAAIGTLIVLAIRWAILALA